MKARQVKAIALLISLLCILCFPVQVSAQGKQGTDGDELKLIEPEQLEIQLGTDWAGVEFQLKTDVGLYPGTVVVGKDGVLRLEIGGSTRYQLTCLKSTVPAPKPEDTESISAATQVPATEEEEKSETAEDTTHNETDEQADAALGIPIKHLFMFGGGMLISVSILIIMQVKKQKQHVHVGYEDDEDE